MTAREVSVGGKKGSQRSVAEYYVLTSLDGVSYTAIRDYSAGGGIKVGRLSCFLWSFDI